METDKWQLTVKDNLQKKADNHEDTSLWPKAKAKMWLVSSVEKGESTENILEIILLVIKVKFKHQELYLIQHLYVKITTSNFPTILNFKDLLLI